MNHFGVLSAIHYRSYQEVDGMIDFPMGVYCSSHNLVWVFGAHEGHARRHEHRGAAQAAVRCSGLPHGHARGWANGCKRRLTGGLGWAVRGGRRCKQAGGAGIEQSARQGGL